MTNPKNEPQSQENPNVTNDELDINWEEALAEQRAGEGQEQTDNLQGSQAQGLGGIDDEWAEALAEQAQGSSDQHDKDTTSAEFVSETTQNTPSEADTQGEPKPIFQPLDQQSGAAKSDIDMIMDIPVQLSVELGRTRLTIKNILQLGQGSVVELDGLAGEPMDIYVNGYLIAQGEVVVVDDKYGIRITDIITPSDRIHRLNTRR